MSVKMNLLNAHLEFLPENAVIEEQGECFHQDNKEM